MLYGRRYSDNNAVLLTRLQIPRRPVTREALTLKMQSPIEPIYQHHLPCASHGFRHPVSLRCIYQAFLTSSLFYSSSMAFARFPRNGVHVDHCRRRIGLFFSIRPRCTYLG